MTHSNITSCLKEHLIKQRLVETVHEDRGNEKRTVKLKQMEIALKVLKLDSNITNAHTKRGKAFLLLNLFFIYMYSPIQTLKFTVFPKIVKRRSGNELGIPVEKAND